MYPEDLDVESSGDIDRKTGKETFRSPYNDQMVVFFINVAEKGQTANATGTLQKTYDIPPEDYEWTNSGTKVAASANTDATGLTYSKMRRLDTAIALHMPNSLRNQYSVMWGEAEDEEMRKGELIAQTLATMKSSDSNSGTATAIAKVAEVTATGMLSDLIGEYGRKTARTTKGNSRAEQVFEGVNFREFEFSYQFFPKSRTEARNILNIIRMFRHHMLPEFRSNNDFMYVYPSEFNIKFYSNGDENMYLEKISTCVLKNVNIDYAPSGQFSTFKADEHGAMPTQINMSMTFLELTKPTKETSPWDGPGL
jgi:hypothetical protein